MCTYSTFLPQPSKKSLLEMLRRARRLPIYQIDAFTRRVFGGNPAAVCPLDQWLPDQLLLCASSSRRLQKHLQLGWQSHTACSSDSHAQRAMRAPSCRTVLFRTQSIHVSHTHPPFPPPPPLTGRLLPRITSRKPPSSSPSRTTSTACAGSRQRLRWTCAGTQR